VSSTKSTNLDAQRILNIIDLTIKKVNILMYIDHKFITNFAPEMEDEEIEKLHQER